MMDLPIRLKVSGKDEFHGVHAVSTTFRFHGWLRLECASLCIEWHGYAQVQEVGPLSVNDDRLPLPAETLIVPVARLRRAELVGGWWRPRLLVSARDGRALALVPSEDEGTVHFWYARHDRRAAMAFASALSTEIAGATGEDLGAVVHLSDSTPVTPPAV
jgi:hypothetical protein